MSDNLRQTATEARERYERDHRFHAQAHTVVSYVMQKRAQTLDPRDIRMRDVHDVALEVAAMVIELIFTEDQELNAQRRMADEYRKTAEQAIAMRPFPMVVPK